METVNELKAIPGQNFSVTLGDHQYDMSIYDCDGFMCYDLSIDDVIVSQGDRFVYLMPMIKYRYQEVDGNFLLDFPQNEDADYTQFGDTQFLRYLTQDESDRLREAWKNGTA